MSQVSIEGWAALVTLVASPIAVIGVFLVWAQLRQMRNDHLQTERAKVAAILPSVIALRQNAEFDWGALLVESREGPPPGKDLELVTGTVAADLALITSLQEKCAALGLDSVVVTSMLATSLNALHFYFMAAGSPGGDTRWGARWPHMVKTAVRYWALLDRLESLLPAHARKIQDVPPGQYQETLNTELKEFVHAHLPRLGDADVPIPWPPRAPVGAA
jgi:hypothetical protein